MADTADEKEILIWQGSLKIEDAESLKQELLQAFKNHKSVLLDISKIEDLDSTIIQLIFSAEKEAKKLGIKFEVGKNIPAPVQNMLSLLNLNLFAEE